MPEACVLNIGARERGKRAGVGYAALGAMMLVGVLLMVVEAPAPAALLLFPVAWGSWAGILQGRRGV